MDKIKLVDKFLFTKYDNSTYKRCIKNNNKLAIIIEPRCHYRLRPTIVNILTQFKNINVNHSNNFT